MPNIVLQRGAHPDMSQGGCVMEFAAYMAGEPHTDHPQCVDENIARYLRILNDGADDELRQRLVPYAIAAIGTVTSDQSVRDQRLRVARQMAEDLAAFAAKVGIPVTRHDDGSLSAWPRTNEERALLMDAFYDTILPALDRMIAMGRAPDFDMVQERVIECGFAGAVAR